MAYNISIKNRNGKGVAHNGVTSITLDTPQGEELTIGINNEVEKSVAPDFSNGNMIVVPEGDDVFSKVEIQKPENLTPDNIAEGVNIAGIIGSLAAGGGGGGLKVATGKLTPTGGNDVVTHGLGVVPSYIFFCCGFNNNAINEMTGNGFLISFVTNINTVTDTSKQIFYHNLRTQCVTTSYDITASNFWGGIAYANAQTFTMGNDTFKCYTDREYTWIAIA